MSYPNVRRVLASTLLSLLAACGGGSGGDSQQPSAQQPEVTIPPVATPPTAPTTPTTPDTTTPPVVQPTPAPAPAAARTFTRAEASRFLARATFGPNMAAIDALAASDSEAWFAAQFAKPQTLHRSYIDQMLATRPPAAPR